MNFFKFLRISTVFFVICNLQFAIYLYADVPTAQFLLIGQGARAEAMGQSVVSNCFDYTATYWNPGASAFLKWPEAGFNQTQLPAEIKSGYLSLIYPYKKFGFGIRIISEDTKVTFFDVNGNRLSDGDEKNSNFNFVGAYKISDFFSVGIGIGTTGMQLGDSKGQAGNTNIGTVYKKDRMSVGATIANLGGKIKLKNGNWESPAEAQPALLRAGISYSFFKNKNLLVSSSYEKVFDDKSAGGLGLGAEYFVIKNIALRGGLKFQSDGVAKPSLGFGLNYKWLLLDYAYTPAAPKQSEIEYNRISFSVRFAKEKPVEVKKPEVPPAEKPKIIGKKINIAVADLEAHEVSAMEAATIADFIRTELINSAVFIVLERSNMTKILAEQRFQQTGCTTTECAIQMGKILNVEKMLVGSFSKMINLFYINVRLVDVETGTALIAETVSCPVEGDLYAKVRELVDKIVKRVTQ